MNFGKIWGLKQVSYDIERDLAENPLIWTPANHIEATA